MGEFRRIQVSEHLQRRGRAHVMFRAGIIIVSSEQSLLTINYIDEL